MSLRVVGERESLLLPVDIGINMLEPSHAENGIIVGKVKDGKIDVVLVGADL